jgi:uncharacterized protein
VHPQGRNPLMLSKSGMRGRAARWLAAVAGTLCVLASAPQAGAQQRFVAIGTGGVTGVYYVAGGALCRLINKDRARHGMRCSVEATDGSVANVKGLRAGEFDFGFIQSDIQFAALRGEGEFRGDPYANLRSVFALHAEAFTMLVRKDLGASRLEDIKGRRINGGKAGSGTRASFETLLGALRWNDADFEAVSEFSADEHGSQLCSGRIDGIAYMVGHPASSISEAAACGSKLLAVTGPAVDALVASKPYYTKVSIPGGLYSNNPQPIRTYGVVATVSASVLTPPDLVYRVVKALFENFDEFKKVHPALQGLTEKAVMSDGKAVPLHEGAARYYRERGWIK